MKRYVAVLLCLFLIPMTLWAEPLDAEYTEPAGDTTVFVDTSLWTCEQRNTDVCTCENWQRQVTTPNQNGATAELIQPVYNVPTRPDWLPLCVRYSVTVRDATGNETSPGDVAGVQVFTAAP